MYIWLIKLCVLYVDSHQPGLFAVSKQWERAQGDPSSWRGGSCPFRRVNLKQGAMRWMGLAARPPRPCPPPAASPMASAWWTTPPCQTLGWWWSRKQLIYRVSSAPWRPKGRSVALRAETSSSCSVAAPVLRRANPSGVYLQNPRMISRKVRDELRLSLLMFWKMCFLKCSLL